MDPTSSVQNLLVNIKDVIKQTKKIPCVPPLFHQDKYVTDFKRKTELFNSFFAKQYSVIQNSSKLPLTLSKNAEKSISSITFSCNDIATIIRNLDPNKVHDHHITSIRMLKICCKPICKPLELIFQFCIKHANLPMNGKWQTGFLSTKVISISTSHLWNDF